MTRDFGLSWRGRGEQMLLPLKLYELSLNKSKPRTACADIDVCGLSCLFFPAVLVGFMRMLQGPQCLLCIEGSITSTQKCSRVSTMVALESFFFFFQWLGRIFCSSYTFRSICSCHRTHHYYCTIPGKHH